MRFVESINWPNPSTLVVSETIQVARTERFLKVLESKRLNFPNPSVSYKMRETVCLDESESIRVAEAVRLADLEHGEVVRNRLSG